MESNISKTTPHIAIFDGLRGLAILMVVAVHASFCFVTSQRLSSVLLQGMFGVQVFFAVSAATLMLASARKSNLDIVPFAVRRVARIAPLYYVGAVFYLAVHVMETQRHAPQGVVLNVLFFHGFVPEFQNNIVPGGWSIGCEMVFYLAFPLLFRWITNLRRALAFLTCACFLDAILIPVARTRGWDLYPDKGLYYHPIFQVPAFAAGIAAYQAFKDKPPAEGVQRGAMHLLATCSLVGIVLAGIVAQSHPSVRAGVLVPVALLVGLSGLRLRVGSTTAVDESLHGSLRTHQLFGLHLALRSSLRIAQWSNDFGPSRSGASRNRRDPAPHLAYG